MDKAAKEAKNQYMREWRKRNPEKVRAIQARYWAKRAMREMKEGDNVDDGNE